MLALQGCIEPHFRMLKRIGIAAVSVRDNEELNSVERIILPGGESSTMLRLMDSSGLTLPLKQFCKTHPTWGICAGAILLAKEVENPSQASLSAIEVKAIRNYYGSQLDSFKAEIQVENLPHSVMVDFIRAPLLSPLSDKVKVLSTFKNQTVCMQQGQVLVSSFHIELGEDPSMHEYFLGL